jgi:hypothetical protein
VKAEYAAKLETAEARVKQMEAARDEARRQVTALSQELESSKKSAEQVCLRLCRAFPSCLVVLGDGCSLVLQMLSCRRLHLCPVLSAASHSCCGLSSVLLWCLRCTKVPGTHINVTRLEPCCCIALLPLYPAALFLPAHSPAAARRSLQSCRRLSQR